MTITATARQLSNTIVEIRWNSTDPDPILGFEISRTVNAGVPKALGTIIGSSTLFADDVSTDGLAIGDVLEYAVEDLDTTTVAFSNLVNYVDLDAPFTYAPVDSGITVPRYTTLDDVKAVLGIPATNVAKDARITQSIVAVELAVDMELGNSFPSTGSNPRWPYVPVSIRELSMDGSVAAFTASNSPHGSAGSDEWLGNLSVADTVSRTIRRNPLLRGYQISFGFS